MYTHFLPYIYKIIKPHYDEEHRVFHSINHINTGIFHFTKLEQMGEIITDTQKVAWLFHDIIYNPLKSDNEEQSAKIFKKYNEDYGFGFDDKEVEDIVQIIIDTKSHKATIELSKIVLDIDMLVLASDYDSFISYREAISKEYSGFYTDDEIKKGTLDFINGILKSKEPIFQSEHFTHLENIAINNIRNYKDNFLS